MTMSDRLAVMDGGRVVQVGSPRAVYEMPATRFWPTSWLSNTLAGRVVAVDEATATVRLAGGEHVRVPRTSGLDPGATAAVVVRPDRLDIVDGPAPAGRNAVTGRVTKVSYLGAHLQIVVQTESGLEITTHRPSTGASGDASGPAVAIDRPRHVVRRPLPRVCGVAGAMGRPRCASRGSARDRLM